MNFKKLLLLCTFTILFFPASTEARSPMPDISADSRSFDLRSGEWILEGNVVVRSADWVARADRIRVHPTRLNVSASGNVRLDWQDLSISADQAVYDPTNEIAQVNGNIELFYDDVRVTATSGTYNARLKQADLFGTEESPASLYPGAGGFLRGPGIHYDVQTGQANFSNGLTFQLFKRGSGQGISGTSTNGIYSVPDEKVELYGFVSYHQIPASSEEKKETSSLSFSSK